MRLHESFNTLQAEWYCMEATGNLENEAVENTLRDIKNFLKYRKLQQIIKM
jgi:hypothetical protein